MIIYFDFIGLCAIYFLLALQFILYFHLTSNHSGSICSLTTLPGLMQKGISIFNRKPSKGIEFLISTKKIGISPEEVASFLKKSSGLNETVIGDYLGEREEFSLKVMHAYVDSFNFIGMDFGEALRFFLRGFRLPGEAQKIDRIMEKFAERYCKCNPSSFTSADTAYVLAYSVILLNTDAHNNMVKEKVCFLNLFFVFFYKCSPVLNCKTFFQLIFCCFGLIFFKGAT